MEVAQIGKGIALFLNEKPVFKDNEKVDLDIVEIAGLAHDLGHPPFGHHGEKALDDCMAKYGGFEANAQTLRILTKIEKKEKKEKNPGDFGIDDKGKDNRYGLNLSYRSLASIFKYGRLIPIRDKRLSEKLFEKYLKKAIQEEIEKKDKANKTNREMITNETRMVLKKIKFKEDIQDILIECGFIDDDNYTCEICLDLLDDMKLKDELKEYKTRIITALTNWHEQAKLIKGYYRSEEELVKKIKENVIGDENYKDFKTIECQIMDIADDIAYSTYDLEDALKGNFVSILDCLIPKREILEYITDKLNECEYLDREDYLKKDVSDIFKRILNEPLNLKNIKEFYLLETKKEINNADIEKILIGFFAYCNYFIKNGYERIRLTSSLIARFIYGIELEGDYAKPNPMMKIKLNNEIREEVEVLKHFNYKFLITSNLLKIPEFRGYEIVKSIFIALQKPEGYLLLPDGYKEIFLKMKNDKDKKRIICDFIAGMTDRYVLEFYGRLKSENPQSIFKPI